MAYTKYHSAWVASDLRSGPAFNHFETQWDEIETDANAHTHDARYYTKTLADTTFFTATYYTGFDADTLDGQHYSDLVAAVMPLGAIMIWSGTDGTVPTGWHICDGGTYGGYATPDLRDRFIIGAGGSYDPGDTTGPATYNGTITPTGSVTVGDHQLTTAELPGHTHTYTEYYANSTGGGGGSYDPASMVVGPYLRTLDTTAMASGDGTHGHTGSSISFSGVDPRPKYHSLYYIMKHA